MWIASALVFTYTIVVTAPKIINSSDSEVCASVNDSVKIYCTFNASTKDGATIVVWLKDHSVISGCDNETGPVQGVNNVIISILNLKNLTHHQGKYTCYCYYNQSIVMSNKPISSDHTTINVHTDCATGKVKTVKTSYFNNCTCVAIVHLILTENNIPWTVIIITGAVLALLIFLSVICAVIYVIRRSKNII